MNRLPVIAKAYRNMPNGGARLTAYRTGKGIFSCPNETFVSNGIAIVARFSGYHEACNALRESGFAQLSDGTWKLAPEVVQSSFNPSAQI